MSPGPQDRKQDRPRDGSGRIAQMIARVTARLPGRWLPASVGGQITLLVVAAILSAHVVVAIAFVLLREPWRDGNHPVAAATRLATVVRMLDRAEAGERDALLRAAARALPNLRIAAWDGAAPAGAPAASFDHPNVRHLQDQFARPLILADLSAGTAGPGLAVGIAAPGGARLKAVLPPEEALNPRRIGIVFSLLFLGLTLALLSLWATRALTAPLARLAEAAEAFGTRPDLVALPENGPKEVVAVARALDRMRDRVRRLLDDRTQMLAAISHDLRTPITRLRLRAEFVDDEHARAMTLRDLDQMNGLVEAALSFVRDGQAGEGARTLFDLASLVQTVCDGFADIGADVRVERSRHVLVQGRPDELRRAFTNLVDNAVKYGGRARLTMQPSEGAVAIEVADDGPGIPEAEREAMMQPFVRGDRARNLDEASGFGLGLSIVLAIVAAHGGRLVLRNRAPRGLVARIELPLAATRPAAHRPGAPAETAQAH